MATCPNKNLNEWKSLVAARGEDIAYYLWDKYEGDVPLSEYGDTMFQLEEAPSTAASPEIITRVKELLKKMGVNVESLSDYAKKSSIKISGVNAVADLVRGVVAVAEGKEDVALTEEMVHIATAILEQKNPTLVTEMISKIDRFKIYKDTLELYKNNKFYQLPNGKPDIRKIKKEAVDKLITELIVNGNTGDVNFPELAQEENRSIIQRWWNAIKDFFSKTYKASNIDIFQQTAQQIMESDAGDNVFFQLTTNNNQNFNQPIKELDKYLLDFLKPFGVLSKEFDSLKERLGVDALGATDVLNKLIWYTKNRNEETIPEEVGHMAVMLMGENHQEIVDLMVEIENWSEYKKIYDQYMPIYKNEKKVKVEAIGKLLAKSLVKNYKANGIDKSLLQRALDALTKLLESVTGLFSAWNYSEKVADKIAINILMGNKDYVANLSPKGVKLDYKKALEGNRLAQSIISEYAERLGHNLVGSLAIAGQGETIYRPESEPIHDLDFIVDNPSPREYQKLLDSLNDRGAVPIHFGWSKPDQKYTTYAYYIPEAGHSVEIVERKNGWASQIVVRDSNGRPVRDPGSKVIAVDFFVYSVPANERNVGIFKSANDIYFGKLGLSRLGDDEVFFQREKDQNDYVLLNLRNRGLKSNNAFIYYQMDESSQTSQEGLFFQLAEPTQQQKDVQRRILETQENLRKGKVDDTIDLLTLGDSDASNFYEGKQPDGTWKTIMKRVTDRVKRYYRDKFGDKTFTKEEQEFNEFKRSLGVKYHGYFEEIHYRYFNKDGTRKPKPEPRRDILDKVDNQVYQKLENYYVNLIESRSKDGKNPLVFSEVKVYDPREKEAGTIDLLIVDEDGTGHIIDWKFMSVAQGQRDIPWYKPDAYGIQLRRYRDILVSNYGVKKISMNRAIPILFEIAPANKKVENAKPTLTGINIGSVDTSEIEDLKLIPISEKSETTGFESLDTLIKELNAVLDNIASKKATSEEDREFKKQRLAIVREAIRVAQGTMNIKPVVDVVMVMQQEGENLLNDYKTIYKDADPRSKDFTNKQLSDFAADLRDYNAIAKVFGTISDRIGDLIYNKDMDAMGMPEAEIAERKELLQNLEKQSKDIRMSREQVFEVSKDFADKFMGVRNLVSGLLNAEAVVKGLSAWFRSVSDIPLRSVQIMMKLVDNAKIRASSDAKTEVEELVAIRKKLADRGGDLRKLVQTIYQKDDDGKLINKLIFKYSREFRDQAADNALEGKKSIKWIKENVDTKAYMEEADVLLKKKIDRIDKDYANNEEMRERLTLQEKQKYDIRRADFNGWTNEVLLRHPQEKWLSKEYLELQKDPELLALYEFIGRVNKKGKEVGYLTNQGMSTFLPWVRKSMAESLAWDFSLSTIANFGSKLSLQPDEVGRGKINPLTKEIEEGIPKYYTQDFTRLPEGEVDTSEVSEDLFANMILYINHMNKYKYLSEVEGQLQLIKDLEKFKEHHLKTSKNGNIIIENGVPEKEDGNEKNAEMYDQFLRAVLYDQKYPLDESDVTMSLGVMDYFKNAINNTAKHFGGQEIFKLSDKPSSISLVKSVETMNRYFQLKSLGLEFVSGAVNWFGTNVQLAAQSGTYFTKGEVMKKQYKLLGNKLDKEQGELFTALVNKFMPLREDPNYEAFKDAGMSVLTRGNVGDFLMMFMRNPEQLTEKAVFMTLLDNVIVQDGKLVNIRKVVKSKYNEEIKTASALRIREINKLVENEIEQLKKEKSVGSTMKMENGELVIPGFDLNNLDEVQALTKLTRRISTSATGGINSENINRSQMNIWFKSAMIFKNWIPGLAFTRFDHLRKVSDDFSVTINPDGTTEGERYDIGRLRLFMYVLGTSIVQRSTNITNILTLNEKGLEQLDKMFEKFSEEYYQREGEPLNMTRAEFIDLIRTNLRNQVNELALTVALASTAMGMGMMAPDDDDSKADKNLFRYGQRVLDKFVSELTFFINPFEFQNILEGNLLPAIGVTTDITRFMTHFVMETTGLDISDPTKTADEVRKDAQPIKNLAKMFPVSKSMINYLAMFDEEFAKEFDITIQKETGR